MAMLRSGTAGGSFHCQLCAIKAHNHNQVPQFIAVNFPLAFFGSCYNSAGAETASLLGRISRVNKNSCTDFFDLLIYFIVFF